MSGKERCKMYKETQSSIMKLLEKGTKLDKNIYMNQIVLIKSDVTSNDDTIRKTALEMLNFLLHLNIEEIEFEVIKILHDNAVNKFIQNCILKAIKQKVLETISENKFNFINNVLPPWKNQNINKLTNIIEDVCVSNLPKDKCKKFFINTIIPSMMATNTDNQIRDALIDIAFMMSTILPISDLSTDEIDLFLKDVNSKYVINIGDLRDKDYPNWHNLWIFLVRFCDKHIHYSMDLTNRLLRVVEFAFRNSSIQQRLKGYDCWKELIDNASLDMNHMCSSKQIKLLVTPLKAKFSKQEVVICKRFDVFTYLLEKLQHKASLCLTEFLEFCFGPVGDNKDMAKTGQGKSVVQIWTKSTKVLIEIIGHSHNKSVSCLATEDVIKLEKPVINYSNISNYYKIIINSVGECCALLKEIDIESKRETVIKCMWKSVFNLIIPTLEGYREKYFQLISDVLDNYLTQSMENPYFEDVLILIFSVLMSYDEEFVCEVMKYIMKQLLTILFTIGDLPSATADKFKEVIAHTFSKIMMVESKLKFLKEIMATFTKLKPLEENVTYAGNIWLCVTNELVVDLAVEQIEKFEEFKDLFMWPAYHLHHLDDITKKQTVLHWMKLYRKITADAEHKKLNVMKDLQRIFNSNPLLSSGVVSLLNVMSQFETKFTKAFVNKIMSVSSQILQLPNLRIEEEQKLTAVVMQYFEPSLQCYKGDANEELIKCICTCIEHILCIHKSYKLLDTLTIFIRNSPTNFRSKFSKHLFPLLLDLFNKESDSNSYNAKELQKALQVLNIENVKKGDSAFPFIPPSGRSARIAHMAKSSPQSSKKRGNNVVSSPTALRLFGKDLDTLSPLDVKGSQLNNITPKSRRKVSTVKTTPQSLPPINDEKSSDFVPINTEVKFQPEKLSKHQKEVLRKRREDIPALYQDLSQSLSQDMFSSSSSSRDIENTYKESFGDKRKVIVEVIGDEFKTGMLSTEEKTNTEFHALPETKISEPSMSDINNPNFFPNATSSELISKMPAPNIEDFIIPNTNLNFEANLFPDAILPSEMITEEAIQDFEEVIVSGKEKNADESVFRQAVKMIDPEETMIEEVSKGRPESKFKEIVLNLGSQNSEETVEKKLCSGEIIIEENESARSEAEEKKRRGKQKIDLELQKLKMDIVGAEEFLAASRRTRTREKPKKLEDISTKKTKAILKEDKLSPQRLQMSRKSLNLHSESVKPITEKNRRKSIELIHVSQSTTDSCKICTDDKSNKPKDPGTPKTRGRRAWKSKLNDERTICNVTDLKQAHNVKKSPKSIGSQKMIPGNGEFTEHKEISREGKRKRGNGDEESEDIIESSQEFQPDLTPVFNSSKRKSIIEISDAESRLNKSEEKTLVQQTSIKDDCLTEIGQTEIDCKNNVAEISKPEEKGVFEAVPKVGVITTEDIDTKQIEHNVEEVLETPVEVNISQDTTVTQESTQDITEIDDHIEELQVQIADTETHCAQTQDTPTQDTPMESEFSAISEDIRPPVLYFDLPKKPELTESERMMCRMDTMSICIDPKNLPLKFNSGEQFAEELEIRHEFLSSSSKDQKLSMEMEDILSTPKFKASNSLPSSPVTVETPSRTSELLNNTLDISPIHSKSSSDDGEPEDNRVSMSINFKADAEELDRIEKEKTQEIIPRKGSQVQDCQEFDNQEIQMINLNENGEMPVLLEDILTDLEEIPNQDDVIPHQNEEMLVKIEGISYQTDENLISSHDVPQAQQNENILSENESTPLQIEETQENAQCQVEEVFHKKPDMPNIENTKPSKDNNIQERASRLLNMVNVSSPMTHKIFIKKRGLTMSPSTARMKKLMSNFNQKPNSEEITGEVKEEDLLTFSREVPSPLAVPRSSILKRKMSDGSESDGISPCAKRKRVNFSDPCLTSKKLFIKDEYQHDLEINSAFDEPLIEPKLEEEPARQISELSVDPSSFEKLTETENFETEPSLEMVNPLMLKKDKPIYPKLVDCAENVILILKRVTSPMFITTLMNKLKSKEIKTIGDLAKQSEAEINRFPFKVPVVPNVYKALDNYYKKNIDKFAKDESENREISKVNGVEEFKRQGVIRKTSPKKLDLRVEFRKLIEKSKTEGTFQELLRIILSSVEKQQLLSLIKSHYKLEINDFLPDTDFKFAIKYITQKVGLSSTFEMLTDNIENSEEESVYFDCVMKHSLEKKSLSNLWENHSLDDVKKVLEESISKNVFSRQEVVDQCLLPLIENPNDISSYVNRLSVIQLSDIIVQRLQNTDLTDFFNRVLASCGTEHSVALSKEVLIRVQSPSEVVDLFKDCISAQNEEKQNETMVEMFKYISGKLSVKTLFELHIDFLKRIPSVMESREKL